MHSYLATPLPLLQPNPELYGNRGWGPAPSCLPNLTPTPPNARSSWSESWLNPLVTPKAPSPILEAGGPHYRESFPGCLGQLGCLC
ncbi:hypothetical protein DSO57_1004619 [Entomophthora muscae]|uniref:Uncharacterized protein n=1 Tax=Entomophthora muscae TaxID=34485 RepID=A0ACC2SKS7_9FUNG|nr:hypothetical protein DSO57_1004619 [Entomophthora muscae]